MLFLESRKVGGVKTDDVFSFRCCVCSLSIEAFSMKRSRKKKK